MELASKLNLELVSRLSNPPLLFFFWTIKHIYVGCRVQCILRETILGIRSFGAAEEIPLSMREQRFLRFAPWF